MLDRLLVRAIHVYRNILSPFMIATCRHVPSCSHYAEEAVVTFGATRGVMLILRRLLRCHPFSDSPIVDPVPSRR
jgi:putative membrane protein insertion efficiency factor